MRQETKGGRQKTTDKRYETKTDNRQETRERSLQIGKVRQLIVRQERCETGDVRQET